MTSLMIVPDDILLELLEQSRSIDDSLRLGMCSRRLYGLLDRNRLAIMRYIILQSDIHKYDVQLCNFKDTYDAWTSEYLQDFRAENDPIPPEVHPPSSSFTHCLTATTLSDRQVWDVVARWHGLALLHELYFHPSINLAYRESSSPNTSSYEDRPLEGGDTLLEERVLDLQEELSSQPLTECPAPSLAASVKERFYMALTGYWLAIEGVRAARICQYPSQSTELEIYAKVDALWYDGRSLHENLDMLEVYDFVYGYLIRQTEPAGFNAFTRWVEDQGWLELNVPVEDKWGAFVRNMQLTLSPADIIEILLFTSQWKHTSGNHPDWSSNDKARYLRQRAFFAPSFPGQSTFQEANLSPDKWYSCEYLERAAELQLLKYFGDQERSPQLMWDDYRRTMWEKEVRGTALLWGKSDPVIAVVDRIKSLSGEGTDPA